MEPIGQTIDPYATVESRAELREGQLRRVQQDREARKQTAGRAMNANYQALRGLEAEQRNLEWELGKAAAAVMLGDGDSKQVRLIERDLERVERDIRTRKLAQSHLDDRAGVVRDSTGVILDR